VKNITIIEALDLQICKLHTDIYLKLNSLINSRYQLRDLSDLVDWAADFHFGTQITLLMKETITELQLLPNSSTQLLNIQEVEDNYSQFLLASLHKRIHRSLPINEFNLRYEINYLEYKLELINVIEYLQTQQSYSIDQLHTVLFRHLETQISLKEINIQKKLVEIRVTQSMSANEQFGTWYAHWKESLSSSIGLEDTPDDFVYHSQVNTGLSIAFSTEEENTVIEINHEDRFQIHILHNFTASFGSILIDGNVDDLYLPDGFELELQKLYYGEHEITKFLALVHVIMLDVKRSFVGEQY
jgi:hypothetical protein